MYATQDITSSPYLEVFMCNKKLKTKVSEKREQALACTKFYLFLHVPLMYKRALYFTEKLAPFRTV